MKIVRPPSNIQRVPPDTRTRIAKFMGDPLPGRSALDRGGAASSYPQPVLPRNGH